MENTTPSQPTAFIGTRHVQVALLIWLGGICYFMQKLALPIGIVAMADSSSLYPAIQYSTNEKSLMSSMYFYGYLMGSIPSGLVVYRFGAAKVMAIAGGLIGGFLGSVTPILSIYVGFWSVCATRLLLGICQGCYFACIVGFSSKWIVPHEREKVGWIFLGPGTASIIVNPLSGFLAISPGGWPSVFYVPGILSMLWAAMCLKVIAETPSRHKSISAEEKKYIEFFVGSNSKEKKERIPWLSIISSVPLWAATACFFSLRWADGMLTSFFPIFLRGVYGISVETNGLISMLPYTCMVIAGVAFSYVGSIMRSRLSANVCRKFWSSLCTYVPAFLLMICSLTELGAVGVIALLVSSVALESASNLCMTINPIDLSPNFSDIIMSMMGTVSTIGPVIGTSWVGYAVDNEHDLSQWQMVFLSVSFVYIIGNTIFLVFGSTSVQPWNDVNDEQVDVKQQEI